MAYIHFRIAGYTATIVLHITNVAYMMSGFNDEVMKYYYVRHFYELQCFFLTCWTFTFQTVHAMVALYCDLKTLNNSKTAEFKLPKLLTDFRDAYFSIFVWPCTILVFCIFWSMFHYDRSLFYPEDIDMAITSKSNHIMHSWILIASLWELMFRPRSSPISHTWSLLGVFVLEAFYVAVLVGVYVMKGAWVYPIFGLLHGTTYFYLFLLGVTAALSVIYHAQWALDDVIWGPKDKGPRVNKVVSYVLRTLCSVIGCPKSCEKKSE